MSGTATDQQDGQVTDEQSKDQAGAAGPGVTDETETTTTETEETEAGDPESEDSDEDDILDPEEYEKVKGDPKAYHKALNRAFTRKNQGLAPYRDFIEALNENPRQAALELAQSLGLTVATPDKSKTEEEVAEDLSTKITKAVKAQLGPDYDDLSDKLGRAIEEAAKLVAEEAVRPLRGQTHDIIRDSAQREAGVAIDAFAKAHPDWKKHEKEMVRLMAKYPAGNGVATADYLEDIYTLATAGGKRGDSLKKAVKRMAASASVDGKTSSVSDKQVTRNPGRNLTFDEAAAMASRGETIEV